ncbi:MAG: sugar transferase [archaeon]
MQKRNVIIGISDLISFNIAFLLAYWLRINSGYFKEGIISINTYYNLIIFANFVLLLTFYYSNLYKDKKTLFNANEFYSLISALFLTLLIVLGATFLYKLEIVSRLVLAFTFLFTLIFITIERAFLRYLFNRLKNSKSNVIIIGKNEKGNMLFKKIVENNSLNYNFMGFVDNKEGVLGKIKDLKKIIENYKVDTVFVALKGNDLNNIINELMGLGVNLKFIPEFVDILTEPLDFDEFSDIPLAIIETRLSKKYYLKLKRLIDIIFSLFLIIILYPFFILISIILMFTGPVIIKQTRLGFNEKQFSFYKFRTMKKGSSKLKGELKSETEGLFKLKEDPRITKFGKVLRRTCLDELPQLFNVLKGDMSLVGPRPHLYVEMKNLKGWEKERFLVRPGMTGLWQVSGRHELNFNKTLLLDLYYVRKMSFLFDLKIIIKTIPAIIFSKGRW